MKVSVIIPAYKPGHLPEALASVFAQTYADYEVIVVNDGSPHDLRKLLQPFVESGRITYIEQENRGTAAARNRGLAEARGEFVALLDDDDYWPADKLEWQARYLDEHPDAGVIVGDVSWVDDVGKIISQTPLRDGPLTFENLFTTGYITSPGQTLIRRALIAERNGFDETIWGADDLDLWLSLARSTRIIIVSRPALYYRLHESNASNNSLAMCLNIQRSLQKHLRLTNSRARTGLRLAATRWLFGYVGGTAIREWKSRVHRRQWSNSAKYIKAIGWMIRGALPEPTLLASVCREILPARCTMRPK